MIGTQENGSRVQRPSISIDAAATLGVNSPETAEMLHESLDAGIEESGLHPAHVKVDIARDPRQDPSCMPDENNVSDSATPSSLTLKSSCGGLNL